MLVDKVDKARLGGPLQSIDTFPTLEELEGRHEVDSQVFTQLRVLVNVHLEEEDVLVLHAQLLEGRIWFCTGSQASRSAPGGEDLVLYREPGGGVIMYTNWEQLGTIGNEIHWERA